MDTWDDAGRILDGTGSRTDDIGPGLHADVVVVDRDHAVIFYFTHPEWDRDGDPADVASRRTVIFSAAVTSEGDRLVCDRHIPGRRPASSLSLPPPAKEARLAD